MKKCPGVAVATFHCICQSLSMPVSYLKYITGKGMKSIRMCLLLTPPPPSSPHLTVAPAGPTPFDVPVQDFVNGLYHLRVEAEDEFGNTDSQELTFSPPPPPTATFVGCEFSSLVHISFLRPSVIKALSMLLKLTPHVYALLNLIISRKLHIKG